MPRRLALLALAVLAALTIAPTASAAGVESALQRLGGKPCTPSSEFTCVRITVPLDHANPGDGETMRAAFAVRPAERRSRGLLVVATGGPGSSGIQLADQYLWSFDPRIVERYDVVFFDQRGIGRSGGLACPNAILADAGPNATPQQQTQAYVDACMRELRSTRLLPWVGTRQAVEDLEDLRVLLGSPRVTLYGESYGTQYGQTYAAAHPEAMRGLIIDGVVDLTLTAPLFWVSAGQSFERGLNAVLDGCASRSACRANTGGRAPAAYDELQARLAAGPIDIRYTLGSGRRVTRALTADLLQAAVSGSLYGTSSRMTLQRAIAYASRGELRPMLELGYANIGIDIETLKPIPDPSFSNAMYYGVDCRDYSWYAGTQEERNAAFLAQAAVLAAELPRIGGSQFRSDYPCIWWPFAAPDVPRPAALANPGIPTFVLNADYDPITPIGQARAVASRLDDGYLIVQRGGPHVIYGRGNACIDGPVDAFLLRGTTPQRRETTCYGAVVRRYVGIGPAGAAGFASIATATRSFRTQLEESVAFGGWDGSTRASAPCVASGTVVLDDAFRFRGCAFTPGFAMTGTASFDARGRLVYDVRLAGRWTGAYRLVDDGARVRVTRAG
jgi:pimeloyl-ACP methyl ester carboxylesterase